MKPSTDVNDWLQPDHGRPFEPAPGAFYRADNENRLCACPACQKAHREANRTPGSPFYQGQLVQTPGGVGIVYQTNEVETRVDLLSSPLLYVLTYQTQDCRPVLRA